MTFNLELHNQTILKRGLASIHDFYDKMSIDRLEVADMTAFATGIDSPFLNVVIDRRADKDFHPTLVNSVVDFFKQHQTPWSWFDHTGTHNHYLTEMGFSLLEEVPALHFNLSEKLPEIANETFSIKEVHEGDMLSKWIEPINEGYQVKKNDDKFRLLNLDILKRGSKKFRHFIALHEKEVAGAGTLFISDDAVMIHNVATKHAYRKQGVATTLTLHMMDQAKQLGFKHCFLDASSDAFNLYKKIGFKIYATTLVFSNAL